MSRFYIDPDSVVEDRIFVRGDEFHHIVDVMRIKKGDLVNAFDGKGNIYSGVIDSIALKEAIIRIKERKFVESTKTVSIALIQAIPKKDKMEDIVEKCTELGIDEIMPVITDRTIVRFDLDKATSKLDRWRKISKEASKQCGRADIVEVLSVCKYKDVVPKLKEFDLVLIPCLSGKREKIGTILGNFKGTRIAYLIGPEGDFTDDEIELAGSFNAVPCDLGDNVLRVDTAAIMTLAIIKYELNREVRW